MSQDNSMWLRLQDEIRDDGQDATVPEHIIEAQYAKCAQQHLGLWLVEPKWFGDAVKAVKDGLWPPLSDEDQSARGQRAGYRMLNDNIAVIALEGPMMKGDSKFGGTNTIRTRVAIREAVRDEEVEGILLAIDSPGGTGAGTAELSDEVARAAEQLIVYAYCDDLCASAAYWPASQAHRISCNRTGWVGSIGSMSIVEDTSGKMEAEGVRVILVSTGPYKGAFVPGTKVTEEHEQYLRERVEDHVQHFYTAVARGRGLSLEQVKQSADGRVWIAEKARERGLIDAVETMEETVDALQAHIARGTIQDSEEDVMAVNEKMTAEDLRREQPEAVAEIVKEADGHAIRTVLERAEELQKAAPDQADLALKALLTGTSVADLHAEMAALRLEEVKSLRKQIEDFKEKPPQKPETPGGEDAVNLGVSDDEGAQEEAKKAEEKDPAKAYMDKVEEVAQERGVKRVEAIHIVRAEEPELKAAYDAYIHPPKR